MPAYRGSLTLLEQYIVVEKVLEDANGEEKSNTRSIAWATLLNLSLTSREFANMGIIKAVLFRNLEFQATQENLARLKKTNIASLAPFVKELSFLPTYHITLDAHEFADIVRNIADHKQELLDSSYDALENVKHYITTHWHGEVPVSVESPEMSDAYETFARSCLVDRKLMIDGAFKDAWLDCFREFQNLTSISLRTPLLSHPFNPSWVHGEETYDRQCVDCAHSVNTLSKELGPGSEGFLTFQVATQCMLVAPSRILNLSIDWELLASLIEICNRRAWKDLTLDHLTKLTIRSVVNNMDLHVHAGWDVMDFCEFLVSSLLEKTHNTLEELEVHCCSQYPRMLWSEIRLFGLPLLRQLSIGGILVDPGPFAHDLTMLGSLEKLYVEGCVHDAEPPAESWKSVFDALRDHQPQLKHVSFLSMDMGELGYGPWGVNITEEDFKARKPEQENECDMEREMYNLCLYISKWGDWVDSLDNFFSLN